MYKKKIIVVSYNDYNSCEEEFWYFELSKAGFEAAVARVKTIASNYYNDTYENLILPHEQNENGGFYWEIEPTYNNFKNNSYISFNDGCDIYFNIKIDYIECFSQKLNLE